MGKEELISLIQEKYKNGERKDEIKQSLIEEGWDGGEIDIAISEIQREALKQMPGVSTIVRFFETLDKKTENASPKLIAAVLAGSALLVLLISIILYVVLDPLGTRISDRDKLRETDFIKIRNAIERYYDAYRIYPSQLDQLQPTYLQSIPQDPKTGSRYSYKVQGGSSGYELCVSSNPTDVLDPVHYQPPVAPTSVVESSPSAHITQPL